MVVYTTACKMLMKSNDITEYTEVLENTQVPTYRHQTIDVRQTRMLSSGTAIWGNGISLRGGGQAIPKLSIPLILVNDYIDVLPLYSPCSGIAATCHAAIARASWSERQTGNVLGATTH